MATAMGIGLRLWTARKVPFMLEDGYPYEGDVRAAMNTIESNTRIWFCQKGNEANYVVITNMGQGSYSDVGMKGGKQSANIQAGFKALHELGHTLGLIHEQVRTDRDNYIEVHWESIVDDRPNSSSTCLPKDSGYQNGQFAIDKQSNNLTDYDPASVMHYPAPATGWQGCPQDQEVWTMRWKKDPSQRLGGQVNGKDADGWKVLTRLDIDGLNKLYDNIPGWSYQQPVPNVGTTDSPALAVFQNRVFLAWKGSSDQHIWWNSFDGSNWAGQQQVPNAGTTDNPALAVFKDKLYLVWKGTGDEHIWYADFDGSANPWSGQARIAGVGTTNGPALAAGFQNKLYMTWKGSGDQHIWYADFTL